MPHLHIFTDGSVNTQLKIGYGACLISSDLRTPINTLEQSVVLKRFEQTSSTRLELQTVLWALAEVLALTDAGDCSVTVYTDSQNIIGLPGRRARLERDNFVSGKGKLLNNADLYQAFYQLSDTMDLTLVKVVGHQASSRKGPIDHIFTLVDQASRRALRTKR